MKLIQKIFMALLALIMAVSCACADDARDALFEEALTQLRTPAQLAEETGECLVHTGDTILLPYVDPGIIPFDQQKGPVLPAASGTFTSSDPAVASVDAEGRVTGAAAGTARITCSGSFGEKTYTVCVGDEYPPRTIQNYLYVLRREFYTVRRGRLKKSNQYTKWYYGSKKEVGWCSVFTIYCANAAGINPVKLKEMDAENPGEVLFLREGQVGHQYDGFYQTGRFTGIPRPGYLIIYAEMKNGYKTTHIASVADVRDLGEGKYAVTTIEGNMANSVKSFCFVYDSNADNHLVGTQKGLKLKKNMSTLPKEEWTDPLIQYELHTDHWSVFGFCATWQ